MKKEIREGEWTGKKMISMLEEHELALDKMDIRVGDLTTKLEDIAARLADLECVCAYLLIEIKSRAKKSMLLPVPSLKPQYKEPIMEAKKRWLDRLDNRIVGGILEKPNENVTE